jgi:hypothetical protein
MRSLAVGSSHSAQHALLLVALVAVASGCYVGGNGEGSVTGIVSAPDCELDPAEPFGLDFDYFEVTPVEDFMEVLLQSGADAEIRSDSLLIFVAEAAEVKTSRLGEAIDVDLDASDGVSMTLALGDTCYSVRDDELTPVVYTAVSGTITFSSLYFPDVDDGKETAAVFSDVRFEDPSRPDERFAVLSGEFRYEYSRRAQRAP